MGPGQEVLDPGPWGQIKKSEPVIAKYWPLASLALATKLVPCRRFRGLGFRFRRFSWALGTGPWGPVPNS